ncbi:GNAT family N-acetyltransferase [Streptomyces sp. NPDC001933]|uniref:GNAT family N-acetyltransferase n=1 Tax=Streptomyces sp. NPDC001933 TaxID=3364626 RepID=UPI0036AB6802
MDWKGKPEHRWPGRHVIAVSNGRAVGNINFYTHPDALAVEISLLFVSPEFRGRGLATMMMDAVYDTYPDAWIDHGRRTRDGAIGGTDTGIPRPGGTFTTVRLRSGRLSSKRPASAPTGNVTRTGTGSTGCWATVRPSTGTNSGWKRSSIATTPCT